MSAFFGILGPLRVVVDGRPVEVQAAKHRVLLAVLLLRVNQVVDADELIDRLWGENPPVGARNTLRTYVMRLRRLLGRPELLRTAQNGYALDTPPDSVDLQQFRDLVERARRSEDAPTAWELLTDALALWRGDMFADVPMSHHVVELVAEERAQARELRAEAGLELDRHNELIPELGQLTDEFPHRERLWALLMRALYGVGRRQDALDAYQKVSAFLADELGIDPGAELQHLHGELLAVAVPSQLPAHVVNFVGRDELADRIAAAVSVRTVVLTGSPGVGKTALAVHVAHRLRPRFPDGQLFVDLRGYSAEAALTTEQVLSRFLRALGVNAEELPAEEQAQSAMFRSLVAGKRILVVLDNAADPAQVRPLLSDEPGCSVLVTSRDSLHALVAEDGAEPVGVEGLAPLESRSLLEKMLGAGPSAEEIGELAELCGHLPLALRIAGANLATSAYPSLHSYLDSLRDGNRLSALAVDGDEQVAVRVAFDLSYQALNPEARRLFRLLGLVPGQDFTTDIAVAVTGGERAEVEQGLCRLLSANLMVESVPGRFQLHDLIRGYANDRAFADEDARDRDTALGSVFEYYLSVVDSAAAVISPESTRLLPVTEPLREPPVVLDSRDSALTWVSTELSNLVAVVRYGCEHGFWHTACQLVDALRGSFYSKPSIAEWQVMTRTALTAAIRAKDDVSEAAMHYNLGALEWSIGRFADAVEQYHRCLPIYTSLEWSDAERSVLTNLAIALWEMGDSRGALPYFTRALDISRAVGSRLSEALVMLNLGNLHMTLGELDPALEFLTSARVICADLGVEHGEAMVVQSLLHHCREVGNFADVEVYFAWATRDGFHMGAATTNFWEGMAGIRFDQGRCDEAIEMAENVLQTAHADSLLKVEVDALVTLAHIYRGVERIDEAATNLHRALKLSSEANYRDGEVAARIELARVHAARGEFEQSLNCADRALNIAESFDLGLRVGRALLVKAQVRFAMGDPATAIEIAEEALRWHRKSGLRLWEARTLRTLGLARQAVSDLTAARRCWTEALELFTVMDLPDAAGLRSLLDAEG